LEDDLHFSLLLDPLLLLYGSSYGDIAERRESGNRGLFALATVGASQPASNQLLTSLLPKQSLFFFR